MIKRLRYNEGVSYEVERFIPIYTFVSTKSRGKIKSPLDSLSIDQKGGGEHEV